MCGGGDGDGVCVSGCVCERERDREREREREREDKCSRLLRKASPYTIQESRWSLFFFFFFLKNDDRCHFPGIVPLGHLQRAMWGMNAGAGTGLGIGVKVGRFSREDAFSSSPQANSWKIPFPQREDSINDDGQLLWL